MKVHVVFVNGYAALCLFITCGQPSIVVRLLETDRGLGIEGGSCWHLSLHASDRVEFEQK